MKTLNRIVVQPSYSKNEPRYAHAYVLNAENLDIVQELGCIAEGRFDIDEKCEAFGKKTWGKGFEIVFNGINGSETIQY